MKLRVQVLCAMIAITFSASRLVGFGKRFGSSVLQPVLRHSLVALIAAFCAIPSQAGIEPSFYLETCAWEATDIIVATEGDSIDGKLAVIETWFGDCTVGDTVLLPELAAFESQESRRVYESHSFVGSNKFVNCDRMILFLKRDDKQSGVVPASPHKLNTQIQWLPASRYGMNVSLVWIESGKAHAFMQWHNPGPSLLTPIDIDEAAIKIKALEQAAIHAALKNALHIEDSSERALALKEFAVKGYGEAMAGLGECGTIAVPVLRSILNDDSLVSLHSLIVPVLANAGGQAVGEELTRIVEEELVYWRQIAPDLSQGWWNKSDDRLRAILRAHYSKLHSALRALTELQYPQSRGTVSSVRDFWRSQPVLEEVGSGQLSQECDRLLESLS